MKEAECLREGEERERRVGTHDCRTRILVASSDNIYCFKTLYLSHLLQYARHNTYYVCTY